MRPDTHRYVAKVPLFLHLILTKVKDDNILVTIEKDAVLERFVKTQRETTPSGHVVSTQDDRITYLSQADFGPLQGSQLLPKLADFNLCFLGMRKGLWPLVSHPAPEVPRPRGITGLPLVL